MPSAITLVVYVLATARLTTLITHDEITRPAREKLIQVFDPYSAVHRLLVYLLGAPDGEARGCPWCVSVWVGLAGSPIMVFWGSTPFVTIIMLALAASQVTGMIYAHGRQ